MHISSARKRCVALLSQCRNPYRPISFDDFFSFVLQVVHSVQKFKIKFISTEKQEPDKANIITEKCIVIFTKQQNAIHFSEATCQTLGAYVEDINAYKVHAFILFPNSPLKPNVP